MDKKTQLTDDYKVNIDICSLLEFGDKVTIKY